MVVSLKSHRYVFVTIDVGFILLFRTTHVKGKYKGCLTLATERVSRLRRLYSNLVCTHWMFNDNSVRNVTFWFVLLQKSWRTSWTFVHEMQRIHIFLMFTVSKLFCKSYWPTRLNKSGQIINFPENVYMHLYGVEQKFGKKKKQKIVKRGIDARIITFFLCLCHIYSKLIIDLYKQILFLRQKILSCYFSLDICWLYRIWVYSAYLMQTE